MHISDEYLREGYWKNNQLHGKGLEIWKNYTFRLGDFTEGKPHGQLIERDDYGNLNHVVKGLDDSSFVIEDNMIMRETY